MISSSSFSETRFQKAFTKKTLISVAEWLLDLEYNERRWMWRDFKHMNVSDVSFRQILLHRWHCKVSEKEHHTIEYEICASDNFQKIFHEKTRWRRCNYQITSSRHILHKFHKELEWRWESVLKLSSALIQMKLISSRSWVDWDIDSSSRRIQQFYRNRLTRRLHSNTC